MNIHSDAQRLVESLQRFDQVVVAFSGGVDSSVVAAAAARAGLKSVIAVTADSASVPRWQIEMARQVAREIGIKHQIVATDEVDLPQYRRNDDRRCFHCKDTLYGVLGRIADQQGGATLVSGTNLDDLGDYRPGIEAGKNARVQTPLADLGLSKRQVRLIAAEFGLSNQDLPAAPCLASRIAYGTEVTPERLRRVERAEDWLRDRGFHPLRVRLHADELARIEVPRDQLMPLLHLDEAGELTTAMRSFGFKFVTVDLQGFQSGSMNRVLVSIDAIATTPDSKGAIH